MTEKTRYILHADLDAFYASVEQRDNADWRGKPVIVGSFEKRGVVSTCSYEARAYGVHSAQPGAVARRLCPDAIWVRPRMKAYVAESKKVFDIFHSFTPEVEGLSLDEAFLDITGSIKLFGSARDIATSLRKQVFQQTGLTISVGIASSKYVAKVASDVDKPDGLVEVAAGEERKFLAGLPLKCLWGAGPKTRGKLNQIGLKTIGDLQRLREIDLVNLLGPKSGHHFYRLARGLDTRDVITHHAAKSVSREMTFSEDLADEVTLSDIMLRQSEDVGRRLRKKNLVGDVVRVKFRRPDFSTYSRQTKLSPPTNADMQIFEAARTLLMKMRSRGEPVRLIGVGVSGLKEGDGEEQLGLFDHQETAKEKKVLDALDQIRERFGSDAIGHGAPVNRKILRLNEESGVRNELEDP